MKEDSVFWTKGAMLYPILDMARYEYKKSLQIISGGLLIPSMRYASLNGGFTVLSSSWLLNFRWPSLAVLFGKDRNDEINNYFQGTGDFFCDGFQVADMRIKRGTTRHDKVQT